MSREKELAKNTIVLSIGKLLPKFTSFVTLPILTAYLTKAEYGTYDLLTTLVMLVLPIVTLQIQTAAFRFLIDCRNDKDKVTDIITNISIVTLLMSALASFIIQFFFMSYSIAFRTIISLYFFSDTLCSTLGQVARGLGKNKVFSICSIFNSFVNMVGIVVGVYLAREGLFALMCSLTLGQVIGTIYLALKTNVFTYISKDKLSGDTLKSMIAYSWPMVPNNLSNWVLKLSDRLVITAFLGIEANAEYAVANKIPNLLSLGQQIIAMAWQENASIAANDKDVGKYYSKMLDMVFDAMFGCTALLVAGTPAIFIIFIHGDYQEAYYQMPILILAMFFYVMSAFMGGIYIAHMKTKNVGISTMMAAAINLTIDLVFVNKIGIWAGSISTLAAYLVLYIYRIWDCQKFQQIKYNTKKQAFEIAIIIVMLLICFANNIWLNCLNIVIGLLVSFFFNKDIIFKCFGKLKSIKNNIQMLS